MNRTEKSCERRREKKRWRRFKKKKERKKETRSIALMKTLLPRISKNKNGESLERALQFTGQFNKRPHLNGETESTRPHRGTLSLFVSFHYTRVRNEWSPATGRYQLIDFHYFKP